MRKCKGRVNEALPFLSASPNTKKLCEVRGSHTGNTERFTFKVNDFLIIYLKLKHLKLKDWETKLIR